MAKVRFDVEIDEETLAAFDALRATRGQDRRGMIGQLVAEFVQRESETEEYDAWFRQEVEEALRESEKPDAVFYSHEEVKENWRRERNLLLQRAAGKAG